mmetsp:Transcript_12687/g.30190  ORF Transcript_12687/g.30190 Transcript_12687/m.30190 type:complete len:329 (-) Transcript_12687:1017-2003(-)
MELDGDLHLTTSIGAAEGQASASGSAAIAHHQSVQALQPEENQQHQKRQDVVEDGLLAGLPRRPNRVHVQRPHRVLAGQDWANPPGCSDLVGGAAEVAGRVVALRFRLQAPAGVAARLLRAGELVGHGGLHRVARQHQVAQPPEGLRQVLRLHEDPGQEHLRHHQARGDGQTHVHATRGRRDREAHGRAAVAAHRQDYIEEKHSLRALGIQSDEGVGDCQDQQGERALHHSIHGHLGEVEGGRVVQLVLGLPQKHRALGGEGVDHPQQRKHDLGEDQEEAGKEARLDPRQVVVQLQEDETNEEGSGNSLHRPYHCEHLVALHVHQLPV